MKDWPTYKIGQLCNIKHGWAFKGEYFSNKGKYILLTPGNFLEKGGIKLKGCKEKYYLGEFPNNYLLSKGDLLVVMTDLIQTAPILGGSAIVPNNDIFLHNQRLGKVVNIKEKLITKEFLYLVFNYEGYRFQIRGSASGATVRHTAPERIYNCKIKLPPLLLQKKIVNILSSYGDLIENNLKQIKLLEELAQITYKEWFIHLRFPDYENTPINPETGLPEKWQKVKLGDTCDLIMGQSPESKYYNTNKKGLPFHQGVTNFGFKFPTTAFWSEKGDRYANPGDILVSVRAPVGRINIAIKKIILGRGLAAIKHKNKQQSFLYYQLKTIFFKENIMGEGAIFNSITKNDVNNIQMLKPNTKLQNMFDKFAKAIDHEILLLHNKNKLLQEARDILLPRLMTGILDVEKYDPSRLLEKSIV